MHSIHHSSNPATTARRFNAWLALWVMVAMLGQALLPTLAYLQSDSSPELWSEICSVVGVRKNPQPANQGPTNAHHADCPLCLQVSPGVILNTAQLCSCAVFFLITQLCFVATDHHFFKPGSALPEARAPPEFI